MKWKGKRLQRTKETKPTLQKDKLRSADPQTNLERKGRLKLILFFLFWETYLKNIYKVDKPKRNG